VFIFYFKHKFKFEINIIIGIFILQAFRFVNVSIMSIECTNQSEYLMKLKTSPVKNVQQNMLNLLYLFRNS